MYSILKLYLIFISLAPNINGVSVEINGKIDLGPTWRFELQPVNISRLKRKRIDGIPQVISKMIAKYAELKDEYDKKDENTHDCNKVATVANDTLSHDELETSCEKGKDKMEDSKSYIRNRVTKHAKVKDMYVEPRKVKDDPQISHFSKHVYKQSLKIFDTIKEKTTDRKIKTEIDLLTQNYKDKFGDFTRKTQNQTIKTRLGRQKVIINTLETSNAMLKRLVNYIIAKRDKNMLRNEGNVFQNEVNKKIELENKYICKKFGICRSQNGFSKFMVDFIGVILSANDSKIKEVSDAITEVLKYADFSSVMDVETVKHFQKGLSDFEGYEVNILKPIFYIVKNLLVNKNKPIEVVGQVDDRVNKTIAVLEIIDAFENALPANEENCLVWDDIKNSMIGWRDGKRKDILEIMESFVDHVKKGINRFDKETAMTFERNVNLILGF